MQHMLKDFDEDLGNYELLDDLLAVQQMCDVISSPLFSALVDIKDQCKKVSVGKEREGLEGG